MGYQDMIYSYYVLMRGIAMVELSNERIGQILHEETAKTEELKTILRGIYTRYLRLYEKYFADIDALNKNKIGELKKYHEETLSLVKYYYMDIPQDICEGIKEFENRYSANLLGPEWHDFLFRSYEEFRKGSKAKDIKADFSKQTLAAFYDAMDDIFREGFGTGSQTVQNVVSGITGLLFGKEKKS